MTDIVRGDFLEAQAEALNVGKVVAMCQSNIYSIHKDERRLCAVVMVTGKVISLN